MDERVQAEAREILAGKALRYRYADLERLLSRAGFQERQVAKGSHRIWRHPCGRRVTVRCDGRRYLLPAYPKEVAKAILEICDGPDERPKL